MPQTGEWLTPVDKDKVRSTVGQAKLDHMLAQTKSSMELQMKINAARAAAELANIKGKEKKDKEALAAKQKAKGSGESLTENLPDQQVDTKNPQAGMQGGGSDLSSILPPAGEAPPFLMDTQRQVTVGPEQINPVVRAPVRRETNRTNVSPNAMTAAQAQQSQLERAKAMIQQRQFQEEQKRLINTEGRRQDELERANKAREVDQARRTTAIETEGRLRTVQSVAETFGASGASVTAKILKGEVITAEDLAGKTTLAERRTLSQEKLATRELELREAADRRAEKLTNVQMIGHLRDLSRELKAQNRLDYNNFSSAQIMGMTKDQVGNPEERLDRVWSDNGELTAIGKTYFGENGKVDEDIDPLRFHVDVVVPFAQQGQIVVFDRSTDFVSRWGRGIFRKMPFKTTGEQDMVTVDERVYWATKSMADRGDKDALKQMEAWGHYKNAEGDVEDDGPLRTSAKALHQGYDKLVRGTDLENEALRSIGESPSPFTDRQTDPRRRQQQMENERALKALEDMESSFQSRLFGDE